MSSNTKMVKVPMFPKERKDSKWAEYTIACTPEVQPVIEQVLDTTSGLIRKNDLQVIANLLVQHLPQSKEQQIRDRRIAGGWCPDCGGDSWDNSYCICSKETKAKKEYQEQDQPQQPTSVAPYLLQQVDADTRTDCVDLAILAAVNHDGGTRISVQAMTHAIYAVFELLQRQPVEEQVGLSGVYSPQEKLLMAAEELLDSCPPKMVFRNTKERGALKLMREAVRLLK